MAINIEIKGGVIIIDEDILDNIKAFKWYIRKDGYVRADTGRRDHVYLHRYVSGARAGQQVDHINRNKLDNRAINLRIGSARLQALNQNKQVKGYYWNADKGSWIVRYTVNGVLKYYGSYKTEEAAKDRAVEVRAGFLKQEGV